jgi:glycosyltransferase involved in cell wall biosynthesis
MTGTFENRRIMPVEIELSVILTTYERPNHLERSLASLSLQRNMAGRFEVVVVDDGSKDCTHEVVGRFARSVDFPVKLTTHEHQGFRVSLCRNDGIRASVGTYVLISDSDCLFPPNHLEQHLRARKPGVIRAGNCYRLDRAATERLTVADVIALKYRREVSYAERWRLWRGWIGDVRYQLRHHPLKPKLMGYNIAISRNDLEAVNGFDEEYVGWGCEDDDFAARLRMAGKRVRTAVGYTQAYHMWHPVDPSNPGVWSQGANVERLLRGKREIKCRCGLVHYPDTADCSGEDWEQPLHRVA